MNETLLTLLMDVFNTALRAQEKTTLPDVLSAYDEIINYCLWWYRQHALTVGRENDAYQIGGGGKGHD